MKTALAGDKPEPLATGGVIAPGTVFLIGREVCMLVIPLQPESRVRELPAQSVAYIWPRDVTVSLASMTIYPREQAA